jgi:hypothetical protein
MGRLRSGLPSVSLPEAVVGDDDPLPFGVYRTWPPTPGALVTFIRLPAIDDPGLDLELFAQEDLVRAPLKNHGVFDETYDG